MYEQITTEMPAVTRSAYNSRNRARETQNIVFEGRCRLEETCCICLSSVCGESVYHTPCGHTYHTTCLRDQIQRMRGDHSRACAMCRRDLRQQIIAQPSLRPAGEAEESDDDTDIGPLHILWVPVVTNIPHLYIPTTQGLLTNTTNTTMTMNTTTMNAPTVNLPNVMNTTDAYGAPTIYGDSQTGNMNWMDVYRSVWNRTAINLANSTYNNNIILDRTHEMPALEYWPWHDASMGDGASMGDDADESALGNEPDNAMDEEAQEWVNSLFGRDHTEDGDGDDSDGSLPPLEFEW